MNTVSPELAVAVTSDRPRLFIGMSVLLLAIVLVGFSPTFYLRSFFDVPDVPRFLVLHGVVMTAWYVTFFAQTMLIAARRVELHRMLGIAGACIAVAVVVVGTVTHFDLVSRQAESDIASSIARVSALVWLDFAALAAFSVCVALALLFRANAAAHKRLMLFASISIIGPALSRMASWSLFGAAANGFVPIVSILLLATPIAHDLLGRRRGRLVSSLGALFVFVMLMAGIAVGGTEFGLAFTRSLR